MTHTCIVRVGAGGTGYAGAMARTALIVIDMLTTYDFEDAERLVASVEQAIPGIRRLLDRAADEDVLTVYVNDNHGEWRSHRDELLESALHGERPDLVQP